MDHILDNPVWNALITGNKDLSQGDDGVRLYPADVAPFAGLKEISTGNFELLYERVPPERVVAVVTAKDILIPDNWKIIHRTQLFQMVCNDPQQQPARRYDLIPLDDSHIPAMLELTAMTNPGPFYEKTIRFSNYYGIFDQHKLVAMAGFRFHVGEYIEISAVCTHPDYLRRGYAGALILHLAKRIYVRGSTPFLHTRTDNTSAIRLYEQLGFSVRHEMTIHIIKKEPHSERSVSTGLDRAARKA